MEMTGMDDVVLRGTGAAGRERVTVVVPVYNRRGLVGRCLDSIYAQTWRPLRVIVVDNNSTDGSADAVREWAANHDVATEDVDSNVGNHDFSILLLEEKKPGASAARNRGLTEVTSEHVIFFDSDDEMLPTLVEDAVKAIGDSDLVYWKGEMINLDGGRSLKPFHTGNLLRRQMYNSMLATQLYMVRTEFVKEIGGWEDRAAVWNDWELGIRIALHTDRVVALPKVLVRIYAQEGSITGRRFRDRVGDWENTLDIVEQKCCDFLGRNGCDGMERKCSDSRELRSSCLDMVDYRRAILAAHYRREGERGAARALLVRALARSGRPAWRRWLLRLLYAYTAAGGRAAYYLWR